MHAIGYSCWLLTRVYWEWIWYIMSSLNLHQLPSSRLIFIIIIIIIIIIIYSSAVCHNLIFFFYYSHAYLLCSATMKAPILALALVSASSAVLAQQAGSIFCQARYITNVATCVIGVKECNTVETFSSCVCNNTGQTDKIRMCLIGLLANPDFKGALKPEDLQAING
ncbi:hypothetical protein GQ42DRAFT_38214 [Ramicandelaber brevisporus]|nr:hypothetical protein GQ42DRAFT_38214 [Ramicandelaber brevisporus]